MKANGLLSFPVLWYTGDGKSDPRKTQQLHGFILSLSSKHFWDYLMDHRHWHKDKQHQPYPPTWVHGPIQRTEIQIAKKGGKRLPEKGHTQIRRGRFWVTLWW